jgi:subfamily B ATP-binding cassette protein MsbA
MSLSSATLMGVVGAIVMLMGTRQIIAGQLTLGGFFTYTMFLGYLAAPLFQVVSIGTLPSGVWKLYGPPPDCKQNLLG